MGNVLTISSADDIKICGNKWNFKSHSGNILAYNSYQLIVVWMQICDIHYEKKKLLEFK